MLKKPLILIGGGGHCKSCIDVIENAGTWEIKGILDNNLAIGEQVLDYPIIGKDDDIHRLVSDDNYFFITIGQIRSADIRKRLFDQLKKEQAKIATIISPLATVSRYAEVGAGTIIHHYCIVNASAIVGDNAIINTGANIEHDTNVGDNVHISTGCIVNGSVLIGNECFIGSGSIIANNLQITSNVIVGAGSLIIKNIYEAGTYVGSPAKRVLK